LRYRVGAEAPFEHSLADGSAALAWIREHAGAVDVDPSKLAVVGFSAGGHLAASLGAVGEHRPDALVLGYPVTLEQFGPLVGKDILDVGSAVTEAMPPTFLFGTSGDSLVPVRNSLDLLAALAAHDVPFESHIYLLGPHGISLAKPLTAGTAAAMVNASVANWLPESVRFLHDVFGDFTVEGEVESYRTSWSGGGSASTRRPSGCWRTHAPWRCSNGTFRSWSASSERTRWPRNSQSETSRLSAPKSSLKAPRKRSAKTWSGSTTNWSQRCRSCRTRPMAVGPICVQPDDRPTARLWAVTDLRQPASTATRADGTTDPSGWGHRPGPLLCSGGSGICQWRVTGAALRTGRGSRRAISR